MALDKLPPPPNIAPFWIADSTNANLYAAYEVVGDYLLAFVQRAQNHFYESEMVAIRLSDLQARDAFRMDSEPRYRIYPTEKLAINWLQKPRY